ncbi:hypothetical protein M9H77_31018 [Catharanthus roseus]|uniref:Uncharacterized protein n=1 Tax=Catharanthus roseus TaxID=4058 RepID=A0ACB9ZZ98_CATRO|nr:hypothetical protein M9H77_31018 [Catharanthus roseus]
MVLKSTMAAPNQTRLKTKKKKKQKAYGGIHKRMFISRAINGAGLIRTRAGLYPFLVGKKNRKYHTGTGIPRPNPGTWRVGSRSRILCPGGYGSGSGSKFNYKGTGLGLGVP